MLWFAFQPRWVQNGRRGVCISHIMNVVTMITSDPMKCHGRVINFMLKILQQEFMNEKGNIKRKVDVVLMVKSADNRTWSVLWRLTVRAKLGWTEAKSVPSLVACGAQQCLNYWIGWEWLNADNVNALEQMEIRLHSRHRNWGRSFQLFWLKEKIRIRGRSLHANSFFVTL